MTIPDQWKKIDYDFWSFCHLKLTRCFFFSLFVCLMFRDFFFFCLLLNFIDKIHRCNSYILARAHATISLPNISKNQRRGLFCKGLRRRRYVIVVSASSDHMSSRKWAENFPFFNAIILYETESTFSVVVFEINAVKRNTCSDLLFIGSLWAYTYKIYAFQYYQFHVTFDIFLIV